MERLTRFDGEITACTCGRQPRHLHRLGPQTHAVECPPCGVRTGFHKTAQECVAEWETMRAQNPIKENA